MHPEYRPTAAPLGGLLALCVSLAALLLTLPPVQSAHAAGCPNEAVRAEQGAAGLALPDCRAYELVSSGSIPSLGSGGSVENGGGKASPDGDALSYFSRYPAEGSITNSETWLAKRSAAGWTVGGVEPQMTPSPSKAPCLPGVGFSEALDAFVLSAGASISASEENKTGECGYPVEELVPGEPRGYANLYLRREGGPYRLVNPAPAGVSPANATFQAASADLSHVVFHEKAELTPDSGPASDLYEWSEGAVRAVGILPGGERVSASLAAGSENWGEPSPLPGYGLAPISHAVSDDGERVFFEADGSLYLRENAGQPPANEADCRSTSEPRLGCTLQIDESFGASLPGPGGGVFQFASRGGDRVFFTSDHRLTADSHAQTGKPDLYEYDLNEGSPRRALTDLTAVKEGEEVANVRGFSGGSDDGSHLYFVARGVLPGSEQNSEGEVPLPGEPNLYLTHEGNLTYIATMSPWERTPTPGGGGKDFQSWWEQGQPGVSGAVPNDLATAWSPSGHYLLFSSAKPLTGIDNTPAEPGACGQGNEACQELFLYDAEARKLRCVSCDPDGNPPASGTSLWERVEFQRVGPPGPRYAPRVVLDDGRVFFETRDSLSPIDVNGVQDVYEYDGGVVNLITGGTGVGGSGFVDASADGRDVFFITAEGLVRADANGLPSVYDARVDGGFAEPPLPSEPCEDEGTCRAPVGPPPPGAASGTSAAGASGNVEPKKPKRCKRGFVRRRHRCAKRASHHRRARHHRQRPRHHKKHANSKQAHRQGGKH